jgi:hypothetical protein
MSFSRDILGLVSRTCEELLLLSTKNINCPIKIWVKDSNTHFSRKHIQVDNKYENVFNIIKRNENQNHKRYYFIPTRVTIMLVLVLLIFLCDAGD